MKPLYPGIPYVQEAGSLDVPPPYHFPGVTVNAFIWEAQMGPVQAYCDTYFNIGDARERGFVYKPAAFWPYATLLFLQYPVMISSSHATQAFGEKPYSDRGIISQTEVFVAIPVVRYGVGLKNLITSTELEWMLPFISVGNPISAVCGREMLGLGKLLAKIKCGESKFPGSFRGTLDLPGWKEAPGCRNTPQCKDISDCKRMPTCKEVSRQVMQEELRFLTVKTGPTLPTFRTSGKNKTLATLFESRQAGWMLDGMAALGNFVDSASLGLFPTSMRTIGLKQYRDAKDIDRAIYQALVSCRALYTNISDFEFYDEQDVTIEVNCEGSFKEIVDLLVDGSEANIGKSIKTKPLAAYRFKADIDFDSMAVVYDFPIEGPPGTPNHPATSHIDARWYRPLKGFFGPGRQR